VKEGTLYLIPVMIKYHNIATPYPVAEVVKGSEIISSAGDILDIMADAGSQGCSRIIIHTESFSTDFFDLRTGVAGEILQKFSNYRMRLAIVGDFSDLVSKSWRDFIHESNRGYTVSFLPSVDEALRVLKK
jgi:hypothetical protein